MGYRVVVGDLFEYKVDAYVNSVGKDASLYGIFCSKLVKQSNSIILKENLDSRNNNDYGDIFVIDNIDKWNLNCNHVINIVTPIKNKDESLSKLKEAYSKVIKYAIDKNYKTMAIPLLGSRGNGYSDDESFLAGQRAMDELSLLEKDKEIIKVYFVIYRGLANTTNYRERNLNYLNKVNYGKRLFKYAFILSEIEEKDMFIPTRSLPTQFDFIQNFVEVKGLRFCECEFDEAKIDSKRRYKWLSSDVREMKKADIFKCVYLVKLNKTQAFQFFIHCNLALNLDLEEDMFMYKYLNKETSYSSYNKFKNAINEYCCKEFLE
jgi:O-acetyl-ADP-ribose deacetylase (regulator of RNase III)